MDEGTCSGGGARTHDILINSQTLCQLSYPGMDVSLYQRGCIPGPTGWPPIGQFSR